MCRSVHVFILLVAFFSFISVSYAFNDKALYYEGISYAKRGSLDFAFMIFDELTREFPSSAFFEDALFAKGEYYFSICDYNDAYSVFKKITKIVSVINFLKSIAYIDYLVHELARYSLVQDGKTSSAVFYIHMSKMSKCQKMY